MNQKRPESAEYNPRYAKYMEMVPEQDICQAMLKQLDATAAFLAAVPEAKLDYRYAAGKWTVREVAGHISDTERIFGYRALCFARGDGAELRRADENLFVRTAEFGRLSMADVVEELSLSRRANEIMLRHMPASSWDRKGRVGDADISVRALAYLMVGHERHHLGIIKTRYLGAA